MNEIVVGISNIFTFAWFKKRSYMKIDKNCPFPLPLFQKLRSIKLKKNQVTVILSTSCDLMSMVKSLNISIHRCSAY